MQCHKESVCLYTAQREDPLAQYNAITFCTLRFTEKHLGSRDIMEDRARVKKGERENNKKLQTQNYINRNIRMCEQLIYNIPLNNFTVILD